MSRSFYVVNTDGMAETESASNIPPWPVDFGPHEEPEHPHIDDSAEMLGRLIVYACIVAVAVGSLAAVVL